jgi:hypothetical protein
VAFAERVRGTRDGQVVAVCVRRCCREGARYDRGGWRERVGGGVVYLMM